MLIRTAWVLTLSLFILLASCKSNKDSQFQIKTAPNQSGAVNNQQLPPGHPDINQQQQNMGKTEIPPPPDAPAEGGLNLADLEKKLPKGWKKTTPSSNMRLAQYQLPKSGSEGDEAECAVFYFGANAGSVDANIERWFGQFSDQRDKNTTTATTTSKLKVTYTEVAGTMGGGMMGGNDSKKDYRLFAAIIETPAGPFFFKATGPEKTIKSQRDAMKTWLSKATVMQPSHP